jgi:hypothetical protein
VPSPCIPESKKTSLRRKCCFFQNLWGDIVVQLFWFILSTLRFDRLESQTCLKSPNQLWLIPVSDLHRPILIYLAASHPEGIYDYHQAKLRSTKQYQVMFSSTGLPSGHQTWQWKINPI